MPTRAQFLKHYLNTNKLKPVSRAEVEDYLKRSSQIAMTITDQNRVTDVDWDGWRALRHPDYVIQWNINQNRFRIDREEYIERWKWTIASGRGWESVDSVTHIIDYGFITEAVLRSTHTDETGEKVILALAESYYLQDGVAVFSNEYIDPTDVRNIDAPIPGGWW